MYVHRRACLLGSVYIIELEISSLIISDDEHDGVYDDGVMT